MLTIDTGGSYAINCARRTFQHRIPSPVLKTNLHPGYVMTCYWGKRVAFPIAMDYMTRCSSWARRTMAFRAARPAATGVYLLPGGPTARLTQLISRIRDSSATTGARNQAMLPRWCSQATTDLRSHNARSLAAIGRLPGWLPRALQTLPVSMPSPGD